MKKSLYFAIAAALCLSGALAQENFGFSEESKGQYTTPLVKGSDLVSQVRGAYLAGDFDNFFKEMDQIYSKIKSNEQVQDYNEMRSGLNSQRQSEFSMNQKQRNAELLSAISADQTLFGEKVRNIASAPTDEFIASIHQMKLGTGQSIEENSLIALDLEYEIKGLNLDLLSPDSGYKQMDPRVLMYALKMEQADKMQTVAQTFSDQNLQDSCVVFAKNLDQFLSVNYDTNDLYAFLANQNESLTQTQKDVTTILQKHEQVISQNAQKSSNQTSVH